MWTPRCRTRTTLLRLSFVSVLGVRRSLPCLYCYNKIDCLCLEELAVFATRDHSIVISIHWVHRPATHRTTTLRAASLSSDRVCPRS